jgi:hypothetical protein
MKKVVFLKLQNDGSQAVIATCYNDGNAVKCEGDELLIANLTENGVRVASRPGKKLYPADGDQFLDELPSVFNSPYLLAMPSEEIPDA